MPDLTPDNPTPGQTLRPVEMRWLAHYMEGHSATDAARMAGIQGDANAVRAWAFRAKKRLANPIRALLELEGITYHNLARKLADGLQATRTERVKVDVPVTRRRRNADGDEVEEEVRDENGRVVTRQEIQTFYDIDFRTRLEYLRYASQVGGLEAIAKALNYGATGMSQGGDVPVSPAVADVSRVRSFAPEDDDLAGMVDPDEEMLTAPDQEGKTEAQARLAVQEARRRLNMLGYDIVALQPAGGGRDAG